MRQANYIKFNDIKSALMDARFREMLPESLNEDVAKFLRNPGCGCNAPIYRKILQSCPDQVKKYFPTKEYISPEEEDEKLSRNTWSVINCHIDELESKMKSLHKVGRKQVAIARYED